MGMEWKQMRTFFWGHWVTLLTGLDEWEGKLHPLCVLCIHHDVLPRGTARWSPEISDLIGGKEKKKKLELSGPWEEGAQKSAQGFLEFWLSIRLCLFIEKLLYTFIYKYICVPKKGWKKKCKILTTKKKSHICTKYSDITEVNITGEGHGNTLQYSCLENPRDRGAWQATVHGTAKELDMIEATEHKKILNYWRENFNIWRFSSGPH